MLPTDVARITDSSIGGLTRLDACLQIFCVAQGVSFFLAPAYLQDVGIVPGAVCGLLSIVFYLYLAWVYFWCESQLREQDPTCGRVSTINVLVEQIFVKIAKWPRIGWYMNLYLKLAVILCWTFGLAFQFFFTTKNVQLILHNYRVDTVSDLEVMLCILITLILLALWPTLVALNKAFYLFAPCMILVMGETLFYIFTTDEYPATERVKLFGSVNAIPTYVNNIQMSMSIPPLLFLYKSEMRREKDMTSLFGSLNTALLSATVLITFYAVACDIRFGDRVAENIIGNLPNNLLVNVTNVVMTVNLILSISVGFLGLFGYVWKGAQKEKLRNRVFAKTFEYAVRVGVILGVAAIAFSLPCLSTLIDLSSSFCILNDVATLPLVLEVVIVWKRADSCWKTYYVLCKNSAIILLTTAYCAWSLIASVQEYHRE